MRLIDYLLELGKNRTLMLLDELIKINKFQTINQMRIKDKRRANFVKKDLQRFVELGLVIKELKPVAIGMNKVDVNFTQYKLNNKHKIIRGLCKNVR